MNTLDSAMLFLVSTVFDLFLLILALRIVLVGVRADYYNPLSQIIVKLTKWFINPLRKIIPNVAHIELSTLLVFFVIELIKFFIICLLTAGIAHVDGLIILALADGIKLFINIFFYAILIMAILSWVHSGYSPIMQTLMQITTPIIRPFRRIIPPISGFDVAPIPAMITLQLLVILMSPLFVLGTQLALGAPK